jgi:hypothetical protein
MAVGLPMKTTYADGDVYSASDVNDITGTVNLIGQTTNLFAGKNKIINGDFGVWQRGTSFSMSSTLYTADRWVDVAATAFPTGTVSRQTFTPGTAPAAGYESSFFARLNITATNGCTNLDYNQKIEDVRTFAGQTVTVSFWAKADAASTMGVYFEQNFGSGGSASVFSSLNTISLTTAWVRYSTTFTLGSLTGKTIGTSNFLMLGLRMPTSAGVVRVGTYDYWGVQVEAGSTATAFQTATGTIQGELAACQRYLPAISGVYSPFFGYSSSTTNTFVSVVYPVTARVVPTGVTISSASHFQLINGGGGAPGTPTAIAFDSFNTGINGAGLTVTSTAGSPTIVSGQGGYIRIVSASGSILFTGCEL